MPSLKFMIEELKRSILPFSISPLLVLIVIIGTKYLGWNADTEVPNYILLPLELRFNVESTYVLVILSAILSFVVIGLVNNYRDNLPKPERSLLLRFVPMASKWVTITFYFWAGAFFGSWWAGKSVSYIEGVGEEFTLIGMIYFICVFMQFSTRGIRVELARA
ncbi:hypothetical protein NOL29_20410 [Vibrio parahaemolyticus]|uniref:hypothetical protein n=1 Tax=Vibrio parahaemolyticus TaxID=670 RepID=UPI00226A8016|nr:hypothetical protein [Vibrio parahaemolyticus]MCX8803679.1 hypothetical protein [Vibrio parahaemolyticus]